MKISIDLNRCAGHGICEGIAEDIFEVVDEGHARLLEESPGEDRRAEVDQAISECPTRALSVEG